MGYKPTKAEVTQAFGILYDLARVQTKRDHREIEYHPYRQILDAKLQEAQDLIETVTNRIVKDLTCQQKIQKPSKKR